LDKRTDTLTVMNTNFQLPTSRHVTWRQSSSPQLNNSTALQHQVCSRALRTLPRDRTAKRGLDLGLLNLHTVPLRNDSLRHVQCLTGEESKNAKGNTCLIHFNNLSEQGGIRSQLGLLLHQSVVVFSQSAEEGTCAPPRLLAARWRQIHNNAECT
jgi:hypothetical protein